MPLDVKPLSPGRRVLLSGAMLVLLAIALGFAQLLVGRQEARGDRQEAGLNVGVVFGTPPGAEGPMEVNDDLESALNGPLDAFQVQTPAGPRRYIAYWLADQAQGATASDYLEALFAHAMGDASENFPAPVKSILGGQPAIEIQKIYAGDSAKAGPNSSARFAIMRLAQVGGHIAAICFSGEGTLAESDKQSFAAYCAQGVHITLQPIGRGTRRN